MAAKGRVDGLSIIIEDSELQAVLNRMIERSNAMAPFFEAAGTALEESMRSNFEEQRSPDGVPWLPSIRARTEGGTTLVQRGHLRDSIRKSVSDAQVEVGTSVPYARIHQLGGTIKAKPGKSLRFTIGDRSVFARKVTIPARPYLGFREADKQRLLELLIDHLEGSRA